MTDTLIVAAQIGEVSLQAEFAARSGRLRIRENGAVLRDFLPPDSWMMIASCSAQSRWGTRPSEDDLIRVVEQFATTQTRDLNDAQPVSESCAV